jgi:hypothetical protein
MDSRGSGTAAAADAASVAATSQQVPIGALRASDGKILLGTVVPSRKPAISIRGSLE